MFVSMFAFVQSFWINQLCFFHKAPPSEQPLSASHGVSRAAALETDRDRNISADAAGPAAKGAVAHGLLDRLESATQRLIGRRDDWTVFLPKLSLQTGYVECPPPLSRTEHGTKALWPIASFRQYREVLVAGALSEFRKHLTIEKAFEAATVADHMLAMQRSGS